MNPTAKLKAYQIDLEDLASELDLGEALGSGAVHTYHLAATNMAASGQVPTYNPDGSFTWADSSASSAGTLIEDHPITASGLVYTLPFEVTSETQLSIFANGIAVYPGDYTVDGDELVFASGAIEDGYDLLIKGYISLDAFPMDPEVYTATVSGELAFDIGFSPVSKDAVLAVVNGLVAHPDMYSLNGRQLTFVSGVIEDSDEIVIHNIATVIKVEGEMGSLTDHTFTTTSGELSYTLPVTPLSEVSLMVSVNGILVAPADYTLTGSGEILTFASGAVEADDIVYVKVIDPTIVGYDFEEAPMDGDAYVRQNGQWVAYIDTAYPVGSFYVQYPDAATNSGEVAFPTESAPTAMFGGTWDAQFTTDGTFFRTEGDPYSEGETHLRTDGKQSDTGQGHFHTVMTGGSALPTGAIVGGYSPGGTSYGLVASSTVVDQSFGKTMVTDTANGDPRIGKESRPLNRLMKIWKRTS